MSEQDFTNVAFRHHLDEHQLMASRCRQCGGLYLPPRPICPQCYGEELEWVEMSGQATLRAFTTVHIAPTAMIAAGYSRKKPYCAGIVRLDEGPAISAQILGVDAGKPESIKIGSRLNVQFVERGNEEERQTFLAFQVEAE